MKPGTIGILLAAALAATACHRGNGAIQREQREYQVVQEGTTSGPTTTLNAPGEAPPPMTDTSVDTTTNFTLPTSTMAGETSTVPTSVAGTLPPMPAPSANPRRPAAPPPTAPPATSTQPNPPMASSAPPPPPPPAAAKNEKDVAKEKAKEKEKQKEHPEEQQPPSPPPEQPPSDTDTAAPPEPAPQTDTQPPPQPPGQR